MGTQDGDHVRSQHGEAAFDAHQALQVLLFLAPESATAVQATSKTGTLAKTASSDVLWATHARKTFGLTGPAECRGPGDEPCGSNWARAFALWHPTVAAAGLRALSEADVEGPLRARWIAAWHRLDVWLSGHVPEITHTLRPALRSGALAHLVGAGFDGAQPAVTALWCLHDGQEIPMDRRISAHLGMRALGDDEEWSLGLLGGYTVYDHEVSMVLLPLHAALKLTKLLQESIAPLNQEHGTKLAFACSCSYNRRKIFFVDVSDGTVWAFTRQPQSLFQLAVPSSSGQLSEGSKVRLTSLQARPELNDQMGVLVGFDDVKCRWQVKMDDGSGVHLLKQDNLQLMVAQKEPQAGDGLLRWFEEFARRLDDGTYGAAQLRPEQADDRISTRGISLFPSTGLEVSRCVTQGVEVTASAIYMPEHQQGWTYSIALQLTGTTAERGYQTCQLLARHWIIQEDGCTPEEVRGEGVVGFFPILADGGWWLNSDSDPSQQYIRDHGFIDGQFRYQSCSGRNYSMKGYFSGDLTFLPGTKRKPTGAPFRASLAPFRLRVPEYMF